jgi:hypothetical protein
LLPILEKVMTFINNNALPAINAFSKAFSLDGNGLGGVITNVGRIMTSVFSPILNGLVKAFGYIKDAVGDNLDAFKEFGGYIGTYLAPVIGTVLGGALTVAGKIAAGVIDVIGGVVSVLNNLISGAVAGINALIRAYNAIPFLPNVSTISTPSVSVPSISVPKSSSIPSIPKTSSGGGGGGGVSKAASSAASAAAASNIVSSNFNPGSFRLAEARAGGGFTDSQNAARISITVNGAIDREGTARTIVDTLNNSYYRGTGGANNLQIS